MTMARQWWLGGLVAVVLSGCGTLTPMVGGEAMTRARLAHSRCDSLPRAFRGVSYDFCWLNGHPVAARTTDDEPMLGEAVVRDILSWQLLFAGVDLVFDTVMLPFTIPQQLKHGNLPLRSTLAEHEAGAWDDTPVTP
ncbi:MAG: hypothetical protein ACT4NV_08035 [Rhodoferax sp.]